MVDVYQKNLHEKEEIKQAQEITQITINNKNKPMAYSSRSLTIVNNTELLAASQRVNGRIRCSNGHRIASTISLNELFIKLTKSPHNNSIPRRMVTKNILTILDRNTLRFFRLCITAVLRRLNDSDSFCA